MARHRATRATINTKYWLEYLRHYWHPNTVKHRRQRVAIGHGIGRHQPNNNNKTTEK